MKIIEYGKENNEVVILLHGGGLSWWNYREAAELLKDRYHVVIPVLDGHSGNDIPFTTIEDNAKGIIEFIDKNHNGKVCLIGGLSLGGQILVEILSQRNNICKYAVVESASVIPDRLMGYFIGPALNLSYGLIKQKWFAKLQFKSLKIKDELFDDYYKDSCNITKENMTGFLKASCEYKIKKGISETDAKVFIFIGQRESGIVRRSAKILNEAITGSCLYVKENMYHGEYSINNPKEYADEIIRILENH